jgi:hypothetical protein
MLLSMALMGTGIVLLSDGMTVCAVVCDMDLIEMARMGQGRLHLAPPRDFRSRHGEAG